MAAQNGHTETAEVLTKAIVSSQLDNGSKKELLAGKWAETESGIVGLWQRMCNGPGSLPGVEYDLESHRQPCAESLVAKV